MADNVVDARECFSTEVFSSLERRTYVGQSNYAISPFSLLIH